VYELPFETIMIIKKYPDSIESPALD